MVVPFFFDSSNLEETDLGVWQKFNKGPHVFYTNTTTNKLIITNFDLVNKGSTNDPNEPIQFVLVDSNLQITKILRGNFFTPKFLVSSFGVYEVLPGEALAFYVPNSDDETETKWAFFVGGYFQ